jgi:hypothetical protein
MHTIRRFLRIKPAGSVGVSLTGFLLLAKGALEVGDLRDIWQVVFPARGFPSLSDYALAVVVVGAIFYAIKTAKEPVDPADAISPGAVEKALREARVPSSRWTFRRASDAPRLFTDAQIDAVICNRPVVDRCYAHFQDQAIFSASEARWMLGCPWLYKQLRRVYSEALRRPEDAFTEPDGYVHWGAMIWRASRVERPDVLRYVQRRMEVWNARGAR